MRARPGLRARVDGGGGGGATSAQPRRRNTKVSYVGLSMVILCVCAHACTIEEKVEVVGRGQIYAKKGGIQKDPHRGILRWQSPCF